MKVRLWMVHGSLILIALVVALILNSGCTAPKNESSNKDDKGERVDSKKDENAEKKKSEVSALEKKIAAARAKLSAEDRALVEAQDYCPIMPKQKLGSMGVPLKVTIKGQPVFLCCKGCKSEAEDEPEQTLKTVAALKAKNKKK